MPKERASVHITVDTEGYYYGIVIDGDGLLLYQSEKCTTRGDAQTAAVEYLLENARDD